MVIRVYRRNAETCTVVYGKGLEEIDVRIRWGAGHQRMLNENECCSWAECEQAG